MIQDTIDFQKIKLIVGLGNIGDKYKKSRHNAGFIFLDDIATNQFKEEPKFKAFISTLELESNKIILAKPTTMMNLSGSSVRAISDFYKIKPEEILVAHDDLDIQLGKSKTQFGKGPKVHNGINDIENKLGTVNFWRFRIGVDNRTTQDRNKIAPNVFVLMQMSEDELITLKESFREKTW